MQTSGKHGSDQQDPYISVTETARLLRVSPVMVYRRFHAGQFPGVRFGRKIDLHRPFVVALLAEIRSGRNVDVESFADNWIAANSEAVA